MIAPPAQPEMDAPAVPFVVTVLTDRRDFLAAARARKKGTAGFHLQARKRREGEAEGIRVGYTCSKKVGNAVKRNRAKRRLREVARAVLPQQGLAGWDYVLIGRADITARLPLETMMDDLRAALAEVHR